jgi:hypothetical protein
MPTLPQVQGPVALPPPPSTPAPAIEAGDREGEKEGKGEERDEAQGEGEKKDALEVAKGEEGEVEVEGAAED